MRKREEIQVNKETKIYLQSVEINLQRVGEGESSFFCAFEGIEEERLFSILFSQFILKIYFLTKLKKVDPLMIDNVYEEIQPTDKEVLCDKECSRSLEKIFEHSTVPQLKRFLENLISRLGESTEEYVTLFSNPFASHAIETLLENVRHADEDFSKLIDEFVRVTLLPSKNKFSFF